MLDGRVSSRVVSGRSGSSLQERCELSPVHHKSSFLLHRALPFPSIPGGVSCLTCGHQAPLAPGWTAGLILCRRLSLTCSGPMKMAWPFESKDLCAFNWVLNTSSRLTDLITIYYYYYYFICQWVLKKIGSSNGK